MMETFEYVMGNRARCAGEECGELEFAVVDPRANTLTHLAVRPDYGDGQARLVPAYLVWPTPDGVDVNCTVARFEEFDAAEASRADAGGEPAEPLPADAVRLRQGEQVHATDGEAGRVCGVVVAPPDREVTHLLLEEGQASGGKRLAVPIADVTGMADDGVAVQLTRSELEGLAAQP